MAGSSTRVQRSAPGNSSVETLSQPLVAISDALAQLLHALVSSVVDSDPGAWPAWHDPQGQWQPLLERAIEQRKLEAKRTAALARLQDGVDTEP